MRRAAARVSSIQPIMACDNMSPSHRWTYLLSAGCPFHSARIRQHSFHSRTLHLTTTHTQQHAATPHTAATTDSDHASSAQHTGSNSNTFAESSSSSTPSSPPSSAGSPVSVTVVATPLSRSAAVAAQPSTSTSTSASPLRLLRVPDLDMGDAKLSKWLIPPNTHFTADCVLCELDTDMAVIEYKADRAGWLAMHTVEEGEDVHVDQPIAVACDREDEVERVTKEWSEKVRRKERGREQRAERPAHSLSDEIASMKE